MAGEGGRGLEAWAITFDAAAAVQRNRMPAAHTSCWLVTCIQQQCAWAHAGRLARTRGRAIDTCESPPVGPYRRAAAAAREPCCSQTPSCTFRQDAATLGKCTWACQGDGNCSHGWPAHRGTCHAQQATASKAHRRIKRQRDKAGSAPGHGSKVGQHAGAQAADDDCVSPQVCCLGADGLCDAGRRAVHLQAQQQLLVLNACREMKGYRAAA